MKTKFWMGMLIAVILCSGNFAAIANNVQISGMFPETEASYKITIDPYFVGMKTRQMTEKTKLGNFSTSFQIDKPLFVEFSAGSNSWIVYIEPGDEFNVDFTGKIPVFTGKTAANNQLWAAFKDMFGKDGLDSAFIEKMMSQLVDATEMELYDAKKKQEAFLKKEMKEGQHSPDFRAMMTAMVRYRYLSGLLGWTVLRAEREGTIIRRLPQVILDDMDPGPYENEKLLAVSSFRNYLYMKMAYGTIEANDFKAFPDGNISFFKRYEYAARNLRGTILSWYLGNLLLNECGNMSGAMAKRLHTELGAIDRSFVYSSMVFEKCAEAINRKEEKVEPKKELVEGEPGVGLTWDVPGTGAGSGGGAGLKLKTTEGKDFTISSMKGKVVYVDIWASWCGPCRGQFPYAKGLKESLTADQKKGIIFLYISIDDNETAWRNAIQQFGLEGIQTISPGGWGSGVCKEYNVTSIPRYLVFDKKGNLHNANAPRPSDPATKEMLLKLFAD